MLALVVLAAVAAKVLEKYKAKCIAGDVEMVHDIDTIFARLTKREMNPETGRRKRRKLFKKAKTLPVAVVSFKGDPMASDRDDWARRADEVVANIKHLSSVVVRIESPGGSVMGYGIIFRHMVRIRKACDKAGIKLIACLGTVGASAGYLAALPAHKILSPELSLVGSIGAVIELLNFNGLLEWLKIEPIQLTAGPLKRTLSRFAPVTPEAKDHVNQQLEETLKFFKEEVRTYRPQVDVEASCTGDHWPATEAIKRGLVDKLRSYEELLLVLNTRTDLLFIGTKPPKLWDRLPALMSNAAVGTVARLIERYAAKI
jgi:serine protease SohB